MIKWKLLIYLNDAVLIGSHISLDDEVLHIAKYSLMSNDLAIVMTPPYHLFLLTVLMYPWSVNRLEIMSSVCWSGEVRPGDSFNNIYKLLHIRAFIQIRTVYKTHILWQTFYVDFHSVPLKFHIKNLNHTLKNDISHKSGNSKSS